jgi:hypothetical protein
LLLRINAVHASITEHPSHLGNDVFGGVQNKSGVCWELDSLSIIDFEEHLVEFYLGQVSQNVMFPTVS